MSQPQQQQQQQQMPAVVGGIPSIIPDVPVDAVFLALFVALAAAHMTIFQINRKRGHWFVFNALIFGFGMSRIMATMFRLIWSTRQSNEDIRLVAQIFLNAGILLVYVINVLFSMRLLRASHPKLGWNPVLRTTYKVFLYLVIPIIIMVIVVIVLMAKRPADAYIRSVAGKILKFGQTYFLCIAATPLVLIPLAVLLPASEPRDDFGRGAWHEKVALVSATTILAILEAGFRAGTTWTPTRLASNPAWFDSKAAFYCFNFMLDVFIMILLLVARMDRRMHVPDKASGPGSYTARYREIEAEKAAKGATASLTDEERGAASFEK